MIKTWSFSMTILTTAGQDTILMSIVLLLQKISHEPEKTLTPNSIRVSM